MALVLFSGGCDSTLLLHDLLKENSHNRGIHSDIIALSINHDQIGANELNKIARTVFKFEMQRRELITDNCIFGEVDINGQSGAVVTSIGAYGLSQPIIWSMIAMLYIRDNDTIYFGYHYGDDFWLHKDTFEEAIQNVCKICNKHIKIEYPLKHLYKYEIIDSLKKRGLYDLCWYCERPTFENKPCGDCVPCRTHRTALWQLETFGNKDIKYGEPVDQPICKEKLTIIQDETVKEVAEYTKIHDGPNLVGS
jgi:7-cyano-7-deazaguanine synthase in queuosine biosynthesis